MSDIRWAGLLPVLLLVARAAAAQSADPVGVRAAGMSGAFVAVTDDASAVYWNPGALASGSFFSLVLDRNTRTAIPDAGSPAAEQSALLIALATPPLGVSYYRTRQVSAVGVPSDMRVAGRNEDRVLTRARLSSFVAHHAGVTLVQSITKSIAVGATLKLVHGEVGVEDGASGTVAGLLDRADHVDSRGTTKFDTDFGVKVNGPLLQVGLTVRNLFEPDFAAAGNAPPVELERQVRTGVAVSLTPSWRVATDWDLTKGTAPSGRWREGAVGTEGHPSRRIWVRGGVRFNTAGGGEDKTPSASVGASYAAMGSLILDAQATRGSSSAYNGWGLAARFVF
jgi:hypothetical protein